MSQRRYSLAQMYDADLARRDPVVARLRSEMRAPHPLYEVQYGDGVLADTTAGRVRSYGRRVSW